MSRDIKDVVAGLLGQASGFQERPQSTFAGIVGGGRQTEIAEPVPQVIEILGRLLQCLQSVETVRQAAQSSGGGNELRYSFRTLRADSIGAEPAFLPDQPRKEIGRQIILAGEVGKRRADVAIEACGADAERSGAGGD